MSKSRENVCWQSREGTWSVGFYDFDYTSDEQDPDFDDEWDVDFHDRFRWASTGYASLDDATDASDALGEANPGGGMIVRWSEQAADQIAELDRRARQYTADPAAADAMMIQPVMLAPTPICRAAEARRRTVPPAAGGTPTPASPMPRTGPGRRR